MSSSILQYKSEEPKTAVCGERNSDMLKKISLVNKLPVFVYVTIIVILSPQSQEEIAGIA